MSQEQLADQVVKTSEEKHKIVVELETASKVSQENTLNSCQYTGS